MKQPSFIVRHQNTMSLAVIIAIFAVINLLGSKVFMRADITNDQRYSISDSSKEIAADLDDIITVKAYFSEKMPSHMYVFRQQVSDILSEYTAISKGNIHVEIVDPSSDENLQRQLQFIGIPQLQVNDVSQDALQVQNIYFGIALNYGDKQEVIPVVRDANRLEYDLTSSIVKLTQETPKSVGFLQSGTEPVLDDNTSRDGYSLIAGELSKLYDIKLVKNIGEKNMIQSVDTLIVAGSQNLDQEHKFAIDQFLTHNGRVIFFVDTVNINDQSVPVEVESGLDTILAQMGIVVEKKMVLDKNNEMTTFSQRLSNNSVIQHILPYPFWPRLLRENFDGENAIVQSLQSIVMPWSSPLTLSQKDGIKQTVLATTQNGWIVEPPYNIDPTNVQDPTEFAKLPMIAVIEGTYTSVYKSDELPVELAEGETFEQTSVKPVKIVVAGDSGFISNGMVQRFSQNAAFMQNAVDSLTLNEKLGEIRAKNIQDLKIVPLSEAEKNMLRVMGVGLLPLFIALYGTFRLIRRSRAKKGYNS